MALESVTRKVRVRHVATTTLVLLDVGAALAQSTPACTGAGRGGRRTHRRWVGGAGPYRARGTVVASLVWLVPVAGACRLGPGRRADHHRDRPARARVLHRATLLWVAGLVGAFLILAMTRGLPRSPSPVMGTGLEVPLQWPCSR